MLAVVLVYPVCGIVRLTWDDIQLRIVNSRLSLLACEEVQFCGIEQLHCDKGV